MEEEVAKIVQVIEEAEQEHRKERLREAELEQQREEERQKEAERRQAAVVHGEELLDKARARVGAADFDGALRALQEAHVVSKHCQRVQISCVSFCLLCS